MMVLDRNNIGGVGKCGRAFVGSDHQIRIVTVTALHIARCANLSIDNIVGDVQQGVDKHLVRCGALALHFVTRASHRQKLRKKSTLGAHRYDQGVFDVLRFHQAQNFGAEVVAAI